MTSLYDKLREHNGRIQKHKGQYAVEIEAEFKEPLIHFPSYFAVTHDHSLRGHGLEFISQGPKELPEVINDVQKLLGEDYFQANYINSSRTSTHVHVNVCNWTHEQLVQFLLTYYIVEPLIGEIAGDNRKSNLFCLRMWDAENIVSLLKDILDQKWNRVCSERTFNTYKYSALNVASIGRLGSVEFRQMRGTNDASHVVQWLQCIDRIVYFSHSFKSVDDLWDSFTKSNSVFMERATGIACNDPYNYDHNYSNVFYLYNYYKDTPKRVTKVGYVCPYDFGKSSYELEYGAL